MRELGNSPRGGGVSARVPLGVVAGSHESPESLFSQQAPLESAGHALGCRGRAELLLDPGYVCPGRPLRDRELAANLDKAPDAINFIGFPLNFAGRDGSPIRAVAIA